MGDGVNGGEKATAAADRPGTAGPIVLYDGWCNLCDSSVAFILRNDRRGRFRFAALQSVAGLAILGVCPSDERLDETMVLVYDGRCWTRSEAMLEIFALLPGLWPWLTALRVVPRRLRDRAYDLIAGHRTKWFGMSAVCMTSRAEYKDRFIG